MDSRLKMTASRLYFYLFSLIFHNVFALANEPAIEEVTTSVTPDLTFVTPNVTYVTRDVTSMTPGPCRTVIGYESLYSGHVLHCVIGEPEQYSAIPVDTRALWLEYSPDRDPSYSGGLFPPGDSSFPPLEHLEFLVTDVTNVNETDFQPEGFTVTYMPNLATYVIVRDLSAPGNVNQGFVLLNNTFLGLSQLRSLYLEHVALVYIEPAAFRGLENLESLSLAQNFLTVLDVETYQHTPNLATLSLHDNYLESLEPGLFQGLSNLTRLYLSLNSLQELRASSFLMLESLGILDISNNKITNIIDGAFNGLYQLHYLALNRNRIGNISSEVFLNLTTLTHLILEINQIKQLGANTFAHLTNLQHLSLGSNSIIALENVHFRGLNSLTQLTLTDNMITTIASDTFSNLSNLSTLDLDRNRIELVEENAFRGLNLLAHLKMAGNRIQWLPEKVFAPLELLFSLTLNDNPWVCDCRLQWLIVWLRARYDAISPETQWHYIVCGADDPINFATFFDLIQLPHHLEDLCGPYNPQKTTTEVTFTNTTNTPLSSTAQPQPTDRISTTESDKKGNSGQKDSQLSSRDIGILAGCLVGGAVVVLLIVVCCCLRSRQNRKQHTWRLSSKNDKNGMRNGRQIPSFFPDPEVNYGSATWEMSDTSDVNYVTAPEHLPDHAQNGRHRQNGRQSDQYSTSDSSITTSFKNVGGGYKHDIHVNLQYNMVQHEKHTSTSKMHENNSSDDGKLQSTSIATNPFNIVENAHIYDNAGLEVETVLGAESAMVNGTPQKPETLPNPESRNFSPQEESSTSNGDRNIMGESINNRGTHNDSILKGDAQNDAILKSDEQIDSILESDTQNEAI